MKKTLIYLNVILLIFLFSCGGGSSKFASSFLNLSMEEVIPKTDKPEIWFVGEIGYKVERVTLSESNTYGLKITDHNADENSLGALINQVPIELVRGKTVVFKGYVKTENVTEGYAGIWAGVNSPWGPNDFNDWGKTGLDQTFDWQEKTFEINVDNDAEHFTIGAFFNGKGVAWFKDFSLYIDGEKYKDVKIELSEKECSHLKKFVHPLKTYNPESMDDEDLAIFQQLIGDAKVVALGEVTHGASEIFKMKHRLVKYLVKNDFDVFSIEADLPASYKLNNYVVNQQGEAADYLKGLYFWTWNTKEVFDMVEWMRNHNASGGRVQFTGFDTQMYMGGMQTLKMAFVEDKSLMGTFNLLEGMLEENMKQLSKGYQDPTFVQDSVLITNIHNLIVSARKQIEDHTEIVEDKAFLLQCLKVVEGSLDITDQGRERAMADNIHWIKSQNPNSKMILWGHNVHLGRNPLFMGEYLSEELGAEYVNIGFAFYEGSYTALGERGLDAYEAELPNSECFEFYFNKIDTPIFVIDLREIRKDESKNAKWLNSSMGFRTVGGMKVEPEFYKSSLVDQFDLLIFIQKVTATELLQ